jgi:hypothetical protein
MSKDLSIERLRREGEEFMQELSREYFEAHAGLKASAELQPVYAKHREILGRDALDLTRENFLASAEESEERRSARLLLDWQTESQSARELAPLDEREIAWEGDAVVRLDDGRVIPYQRTAIELANSTDKRERATIEKARSALVQKELAPMKRERFQRERDITESLGLANGYIPTWELLNGISLSGLRDECAQFLRDTQAMWDEVCPEFVKRGLGMTMAEVTRASSTSTSPPPRWSRRSDARYARWASIRRPVGACGSIRASARGSGRARSAHPCACRTRCISCCGRTAGRPTGRPSCTSWDTRCTSRTCAPTIRWSSAGWGTTR